MNNLMITRLKKKYTKKHLADRAGISAVTYGKIESGDRTAEKEVSEKIAAALGVEVDDIFLPARLTPREVIIKEVK